MLQKRSQLKKRLKVVINMDEMRHYANDDVTLEWHLTSNMLPPVTLRMVPVCKDAIEYASNDDWDRLIELPEGITYDDQAWATAREIVENFHLDGFLVEIED